METPGTILSYLKLILSQESKAEAIHFQRMTKTSRATIKDMKDKGHPEVDALHHYITLRDGSEGQ